MFDDQLPKAPAASSAKVEDMFDGVASTPPRSPLLPSPHISPASLPETSHPEPNDLGPRVIRFGLFKIALVVALVLALVGAAAYAAWRIMGQAPQTDGVVQSVTDNGVIDDEVTSDKQQEENVEKDVKESVPEENKPSFLDSDGDGLTNAEELEAGTLANKADSDSDGLGDREEVEVYDTDPRDADTDNDTYLDGQEVKGGFNPNGEGRLFAVPESE